jgi:hypothetical protein
MQIDGGHLGKKGNFTSVSKIKGISRVNKRRMGAFGG